MRPVKEVTHIGPDQAMVVGSSICRGRWLPEAVEFVETHQDALSQMPVAYFLVCLIAEGLPRGEPLRGGGAVRGLDWWWSLPAGRRRRAGQCWTPGLALSSAKEPTGTVAGGCELLLSLAAKETGSIMEVPNDNGSED